VNKFLTISFSTFLMFSNLTELQAYEPIDQSFCPYGYHPEGPSFAYDCVSNSTGEIQGSESNRQEHEAIVQYGKNGGVLLQEVRLVAGVQLLICLVKIVPNKLV